MLLSIIVATYLMFLNGVIGHSGEKTDLIEEHNVRQLIRRWWWSYVDVINNITSKDKFNDNMQDIFTSDAVLEEPGIFRYDGMDEMLDGSVEKELPSIVDGLLAFDIEKLLLADMYVQFDTNDHNGPVRGATVRAFKTLLYGDQKNINYNYDYWTLIKTGPKNKWKAKELTIYLDTYDSGCQCTN